MRRNGDDRPRPQWYRRFSLARVAVVAFILCSALFWIWALSPLAPSGNADRLDDRAFPEAADEICERYQAEIDALPRAFEVESPAERAVDVAAGTELTRQMIAELESIPRPTGDDARIVELWFTDWQQYVEDRMSYEQRLVDNDPDDDLRFLLTLVDDVPVDDRIGNFARVNDMDACEIPGDA